MFPLVSQAAASYAPDGTRTTAERFSPFVAATSDATCEPPEGDVARLVPVSGRGVVVWAGDVVVCFAGTVACVAEAADSVPCATFPPLPPLPQPVRARVEPVAATTANMLTFLHCMTSPS